VSAIGHGFPLPKPPIFSFGGLGGRLAEQVARDVDQREPPPFFGQFGGVGLDEYLDAKTLREIGRLERTLLTLDWISDPALRRRTNAGLNKGEARNALARAVFFHRLGEIRDRTFENQRYRASGLNLAVAAIILWNTVYLGRAVDELRSRGEIIPDDLLAHVAPLGWEHIAFNGDYVWPAEPLGNAFRPLRNPRAEFLDAA
jgi:hypothetical protein